MITPELLHRLATLAGRAPSLHNTQPWRFRLDHDVVELRIDPARALPSADPRARELVIGCGAALYTVRLALRGEGMTPSVDLLPASGDPLLLARIAAKPGPAPTEDELRMLAVVVRRHTQRHGFTAGPLSVSVASAVADAARSEGADLRWVTEPARVAAVVGLALLAEQMRAANPHWRQETTEWVRTRAGSDGIPHHAVPHPGSAPHPLDRLPVAHFLPKALAHAARPQLGRPGRLAVLTTPSDTVLDWVSAGQALQRLLLRAADDWVFASYNTAPLENPSLREELRDALELTDHPQMLFELGHVNAARATPRRPTTAFVS